MPVLQLVTCYQVTIKPGAESAWVGNFLEPPSLSGIRLAVETNLGLQRRRCNGTLLDVLDGIDPDHEQRLMRYKPQNKDALTLQAFTPSGHTCLGDIRICEGIPVICRAQTGDHG